MEAIVYPKRPNTRRNTSYPRAPAEYSDWCRKYLFYDTAVRSWHTPYHPKRATAALACCKAIIDAMVYLKRLSTQRDTPYPRAPAE